MYFHSTINYASPTLGIRRNCVKRESRLFEGKRLQGKQIKSWRTWREIPGGYAILNLEVEKEGRVADAPFFFVRH